VVPLHAHPLTVTYDTVAAGGLAPVVIEQCETVTHYEPNLTLHGLRMIWDRNV
jgi:type III pantothenate kinase